MVDEEEKISTSSLGPIESIVRRLLLSGIKYHSHTKGTYPVTFYTDPVTHQELALKLFHPAVHTKIRSAKERERKTDGDYRTEIAGHKLLSDSMHVVRAMEWEEYKQGFTIPILMPDGTILEQYHYILMSTQKGGNIMSFLMKAIYNNGGKLRRLSLRLQ